MFVRIASDHDGSRHDTNEMGQHRLTCTIVEPDDLDVQARLGLTTFLG